MSWEPLYLHRFMEKLSSILVRGFVVALLLLSFSCIDEPECVYENLRELKLRFVNSEKNYADTLRIDSIVVSGIDSAFYEGKSLFELTLPINVLMDETTYFFDLQDTLVDFSIIIGYDMVPRVISPDCGIEAEIRNLSVVEHDVDSVKIISDILLEDIELNVRVYR